MSLWVMFLMVLAIIIALLLLIPSIAWLRRALGYMFLADVASSAYCISTFAMTSAVSGLAIAIFAALGISLTLRGIRFFAGTERLAVNGDTSLRLVSSEVLSQGTSWARAIFMSLFRGGRVDAPAALNVAWLREESKAARWYASTASFVEQRIAA